MPICGILLPLAPSPLPTLENQWDHHASSSTECIEFSYSQEALFLNLASSSAWQGDFSKSRVRYNCSSIAYSASHTPKKYLISFVLSINHRISPNQQNNLNQGFTVWLSMTIPNLCWRFPSSLLLNQMVHVLASLLSFSDRCTLSKDRGRKPATLSAAVALPWLLNVVMVPAAFANAYPFLNLSFLPKSLTY